MCQSHRPFSNDQYEAPERDPDVWPAPPPKNNYRGAAPPQQYSSPNYHQYGAGPPNNGVNRDKYKSRNSGGGGGGKPQVNRVGAAAPANSNIGNNNNKKVDRRSNNAPPPVGQRRETDAFGGLGNDLRKWGRFAGGAFTAEGVRRIRQVDSFLCEITQENKHNLKRQPEVAVNYSCLFIICS